MEEKTDEEKKVGGEGTMLRMSMSRQGKKVPQLISRSHSKKVAKGWFLADGATCVFPE